MFVTFPLLLCNILFRTPNVRCARQIFYTVNFVSIHLFLSFLSIFSSIFFRRVLRWIWCPSTEHVWVGVHVQLRYRWWIYSVPDWLEHGTRIPNRDVGLRVRPERQFGFAHQRGHKLVRPELDGIFGWVRLKHRIKTLSFFKKKKKISTIYI